MAVFYSAVEVIEMAIKTEEAGKLFYESVARKTRQKNLKELFQFLASEETKHKQLFTNLYQLTKEKPEAIPYNWDEMNLYLKALSESRFFLGEDKAINLVKKAKTPKQALDYALGFERDTMLFYTEITNIVSEQNRELVNKIIAQEKNHIRQLQAMKENLKSKGNK